MDQYHILEEIDRGGMGIVYRAQDLLTGNVIALKKVLITPDQLMFRTRMRSSSADDLRLALAREFQMLAGLRHPNIISVRDYGFGRDDSSPYFTMDYLSDAQTILQAAHDQSLEQKISLVAQMLDALAYLHRRGIIHRDMKPANVLVSGGVVKVLDFGLAHARRDVDDAGRMMGTIMYMAPEALSGGIVTEATDLYAAGLILYEVLTGDFPFDRSDTTRMVNDVLLHPPNFDAWQKIAYEQPELNASITLILEKLLAKNPADRYQRAEDVLHDLYQATGVRQPRERADVRESYLQSASFVGRYTELVTLIDALARAQMGRGAAYLIGGESGVGKSRLIDELRTRALVRGVLVVRGQAMSNGGLPFQIWREPLRRLILSARDSLTDLEISVLRPLVPDISTLIGRDAADAADVDSKARQQRLNAALIHVFRSVKQPILLILEDLQWTLESLNPLASLCEIVAELPVLIVASFRDDERPNLPDELPKMNMIRLDRLDPDSIADLTASMLGDAGKQPQVLDLLVRETEGNVFFLIETVRALAEEAGRLSEIGRSTLPARVITGGMQAVVARRLSRIPENERALLKAAAVIGRQIDYKVMRRFVDAQDRHAADQELERWLTIGVNAAVLDWQDGYWRFAHDKLRETVLDQLSDDDRKVLHRRAALALEQVYPNDNARASILADHWRMAGDAEKESSYLVISALHAFNYAQFREALQLAERGLSLASDPQVRMMLKLRLGEANMRLNFYPAAISALGEVLVDAQALDDKAASAQANGLLANCLWETGDYPLGIEHGEASLRDAEAAGRSELISRAANILGNLNWYTGNYDVAEQYFHRSLQAATSVNALREMSVALTNIGLVYQEHGNIDAAFDHMNRSLAIKEQVGDIRGLAVLAINMADLVTYQQDWEAELRYAERAVKLASSLGDRLLEASTLRTLSTAYKHQGALDSAVSMMLDSLKITQEYGDRPGVISTMNNLASLYHMQGKREEQAHVILQALQVCLEIGAFPRLMGSLTHVTRLYMSRGEFDQALVILAGIEKHPAMNEDMHDTFWKDAYSEVVAHFGDELKDRLDVFAPQIQAFDAEAYTREIVNKGSV